MVKFIVSILLFIEFTAIGQSVDTLSWRYQIPEKNDWYTYGLSGSIQEKLMSLGMLKAPYFLNNEDSIQWIEEYNWELFSEFQIDSSEFLQDVFIELESVDTYSAIYVNDILIGNTSNSFRPYIYQINDAINVGTNDVKIILTPPVLFHKGKVGENRTYPAPNDVADIKVASLTRKPQYQFGWDWTMRVNTIGLSAPVVINKGLGLHAVNKRVNLIELHESHSQAILEFNFIANRNLDQTYYWESDLFGTSIVKPERNMLKRTVVLDQPTLWWPRGQGHQFLYSDVWKIKDSTGKILSVEEVQFGIRKAELIQSADTIGRAFKFLINDRYVFCKGANYIPPSVFVSKIDSNRIQKDIETMSSSNFNMIRVWGGGIYLPDYFYELCDQNGIMVWQDFMFACAMYPGSNSFIEEVQQEVNFQLDRLSGHPSIVLFNGNNEVEVAYNFWGLKDAYKISDEDWESIGNEQELLFKDVIASAVLSNYGTPYVHTSPLSNWGSPERFNYGSQHYWGVWHGNDDPFEGFSSNIGRFNSEYGYQSFPQTSTLLAFSSLDDLSLESDLMKMHQKSYVGNEKIMNHIREHYRKPRNFHDFVYLSQILQADAVNTAIVEHRLATERCAGTLYWQFNDCFPGPTWSGIDYFDNWKALQYKVKESYRDLTVLRNSRDEYYWMNDTGQEREIQLKMEVNTVTGYSKSIVISFESKSNEKILISLPKGLLKKIKKKSGILSFEWEDLDGSLQKSSFVYKSAKRQISTPRCELYSYNDESGVGYIMIKTTGLIEDLWIEDLHGLSQFNENFLDLLPGQYLIKFQREKEPSSEDFILSWN